jgi:AraC-like DNA-binding protein
MRRALDPRVALGVEALRSRPGDVTPVAALAQAAGLSASRFQHLFAAEIGVPYRRYRAWERMRAAIREVLRGANLTGAAHAAGYTDQAHFAHDFKRIFGAPATPSLINARG